MKIPFDRIETLLSNIINTNKNPKKVKT